MDDFDEDPLDLFDDDGDGVIEMSLLFGEDSKNNKQSGLKAPRNTGCCMLFLITGTSIAGTAFIVKSFIA